MPELYLIDGSSYIYRAYHAMRGLSTSKGMPTNAIYIFTNMILKILNEKKPQFLAIAFDPGGPTTRHKTYEAYKAQRPPMPDSLSIQVPYIYRIVEAFNIPVLIKEGYEADDVIGSVAKKGEKDGYEVIIVTGDKDMLQLVSPHILIYDPMKDKLYGEAEVVEKFGVMPQQVVDIMALMGDSIDNIPGVRGIGEKTARELIATFSSVENLLEHLQEIKKTRIRQLLEKDIENLLLSRDLARIHTELPVEIDYESLEVHPPDREKLITILRELEFSSLLKTFPDLSREKEEGSYKIIRNEKELSRLVNNIRDRFSIFIEDETSDPLSDKIRSIGISFKDKEGWFIPIEGKGEHKTQTPPFLIQDIKELLSQLIEDPHIEKFTHDIKRHLLILRRHGFIPGGFVFDTMIASYLLNPGRSDHSLKGISLEYLQKILNPHTREDDLFPISPYAGKCADYIWRLKDILEEELAKTGMESLFYDIELPLTEVLAHMEMCGIKIDRNILEMLSKEMAGEMERICRRIYTIAEEEFNINSPRQLSRILFDKIGLKPIRKTKTGYSTDESVLTELAASHELPAEILNYRQIAKLKSTYVDALLSMVNPETGRIHTSFSQTVTATGRLSSSKPNLQNIPIRSEMGQRVREAFVAEEGWILLAADYSQIELRILAHMSGDELLIESFRRGEDIHTRTASEVFNVPSERVTPEIRRRAKAINFGIVYGMSPYGLSSDIGISQEEAKRYIDNYFSSHQGVRRFIEETLSIARERGYVTTLFNRRRYIPELKSRDNNIRQFGERVAINTPIQGSAADIIKLAMINIHRRLNQEGLKGRMILQVHDELLFEIPEKEIKKIEKIVVQEMEGVVSLSVPLKVDIGMGSNWREAG